MKRKSKRKIGIFLGRLQPQHRGHEMMIEKIFEENDEVILCIGSAQKIRKSDPLAERNPLPVSARIERLKSFLEAGSFEKPYKIVAAIDIEPDSEWPMHLKKSCGLDDSSINTVYFGDPIPKEYEEGMKKAGFELKFIKRKKFLYRTAKNSLHKISSATEIRALERDEFSSRPETIA